MKMVINKLAALFGRGQTRAADRVPSAQGTGDDPQRLLDEGNSRLGAGEADAAVALFRRAIAADPGFAAAHCNLGATLSHLNRREEAVDALKRALALNPALVNARFHLGRLWDLVGEQQRALEQYHAAIDLDPSFYPACLELARIEFEAGNLDLSSRALSKGLAARPDVADLHNFMGNVCAARDDVERAAECFHSALSLAPNHGGALFNLGLAAQKRGQWQEALALFEAAVLRGGYSDAYPNLAEAKLFLGDYADGFRCYEQRIHAPCKDFQFVRGLAARMGGKPFWQGEPLEGKAILVWCEQGLGDSIMMMRYLPLLANRGAGRVLVYCDPPLFGLLRALPCVAEVLSKADATVAAGFDCHCSLYSMPFLFQTTVGSIPLTFPYLRADPVRSDGFGSALKDLRGTKVGLCWKGSAGYKRDSERSPGLAPFGPLFEVDGARFFALVPGGRDEFVSAAGEAGVDLGHEIDCFSGPFVETAALVSQLDLVVTCDTSLAHLAGALGKPVWIVLPFRPDWRWMADRDDSPWYPSARLFRQRSPGNWTELFGRLKTELAALCANADSSGPDMTQAHASYRNGELELAEQICRRLLDCGKDRGMAALLLGEILFDRAAFGEAQAWLNVCGQQCIGDPHFHHLSGLIHAALGESGAAEESFSNALQLRPDYASTHHNLGVLLEKNGRGAAAKQAYREAIRINPGFGPSCNNLGVLCLRGGEFGEAAALLGAALAATPHSDPGDGNLEWALAQSDGPQGDGYPHRLALMHWNLALALLQLGRYGEAWPHYEWRVKLNPGLRPGHATQRWRGQDLAGRPLLVLAEQGLGDTLLFARYLELLRDLGIRVAFRCQRSLVRLLAHCQVADLIFADDAASGALDGHVLAQVEFHIPLMSLAKVFSTGREGIPTYRAPLAAPPDLAAKWQPRLGGGRRMRVGLVWASNGAGEAAGELVNLDKRLRSCPAVLFGKFLELADIDFFSLQHGAEAANLAAVARSAPLIDCAPYLSDFSETAAALSHMDVLVCVDTSVAHLGGAMGKPVFLLCREPSDWRWQGGQPDSTWYPSVRIFRQGQPGDWEGVVGQVAQALSAAEAAWKASGAARA